MFSKLSEWKSDFSSFENHKVLVMLSGGKDSVCCIAILRELGIHLEAIHFAHTWDWPNSHQEAKRSAAHFQVPLHEFDISKEFAEIVKHSTDGRPCRHCKPVMYIKAMEFAIQNGFGWICVGDNLSDTIVTRLSEFEEKLGNTNLYFTDYLDCIEKGIPVARGLKILRPLIYTSAKNVEKFLYKRYDYIVQKNFETGDKYFGYWREGCPIQYTDPGFQHSTTSLCMLRDINGFVSEYARNHDFRASYHYPSEVIVTVPQGHEEEVRDYLVQVGYQNTDKDKELLKTENCKYYKLLCQQVSSYYLSSQEVFLPLANRFAERTIGKIQSEFSDITPLGIIHIQIFSNGRIIYRSGTDTGSNNLTIEILLNKMYSGDNLKHIAFEVFKAPIIKLRAIK
jgi:hypothetical protein